MKEQVWREAFRDTVPVIAGYTVLGMGFGILMVKGGYGIWHAVAMSLFIYAGSMQYAAVGLFDAGASLLTAALTALAVNARHLFYGISMLDGYGKAGKEKPYLIFSLTDETYSLVCDRGGDLRYCLAVSVLDHCYWVGGTLAGALLGGALTFDTRGIDFALTALFVTVFVSQWLEGGGRRPALAGVGCSVLCLLVFGPDSFLIPSMILIAAALLAQPGKGEEHADRS